VAGDAGVGERQFGCADGTLGLACGPGRDLLDEEHCCEQFEVAVEGGPGDARFGCEGGWDEQAAGAPGEQGQQAAQVAAPFDHCQWSNCGHLAAC
jgi:hypothetical protein